MHLYSPQQMTVRLSDCNTQVWVRIPIEIILMHCTYNRSNILTEAYGKIALHQNDFKFFGVH